MAGITKANTTQKGQEVPNFTEEQARDYFEKLRWPDGNPYCPHCGSVNVTRMQGEKHRAGAIQCNDCRKQFTVTVGSVLEDTHLPLAKWALAFHLMCSSKKGVSALQLQRNLGLRVVPDRVASRPPHPAGDEGRASGRDARGRGSG